MKGDMENKNSLHQNCGPSPSPTATYYSEEKPKHNKQMVCGQGSKKLCTEDDATSAFFQRYDHSRVPICPYSTRHEECPNDRPCFYNHANEVGKECLMYNFGFCPNGPNCGYKHTKLPGPPPPVEEVLEIIKRQKASSNKSKYRQAIRKLHFSTSSLPQGTSSYFVVKSNNLENLQLSIERGMWATQPRNESILDEAFHRFDNVLLIFSVNQAHHFHGCATMVSKIGGVDSQARWNDGHGRYINFGKNFGVKWLKQCELPFQKTRHLTNPFNSNLPVQISRDCQELEPSIGEGLVSLLFLEEDVNFMIG